MTRAFSALLVMFLALGCRTTMKPAREVPQKDPSTEWDEVLSEVVTEDGFVDYDLLEENRETLLDFVAWLSGGKYWLRNDIGERHAPYLNAYNALVLYQVLERGRPASVLDVQGLLPKAGSGFFLETAFELGPDKLSLSEIEHERIRMAELDYRSHAAMNCASISCPPLRAGVYSTKEADFQTQLREQMMAWIKDDGRGVRIEDGEAVFNPIFDWYARDFDFWSAGQDLCTLASKYAVGEKRNQLVKLAKHGCPHRFAEYDWRLNSVRNARDAGYAAKKRARVRIEGPIAPKALFPDAEEGDADEADVGDTTGADHDEGDEGR